MASLPTTSIPSLTEATSVSDSDLMLIYGIEANKIKWSTICNLIKAKLGIGTAATQAVANNLTTTAAGSVLDARQGKALADMHKVSRIELLTSGSENSAVNGAYIKKSGNVKLLTVAGTIKIAMDAGTEYTLGQITNTDYQPTYLVQQIEIIRPNGDIGAIKIATDGTVSLTPNVTMAVNTTLRFRAIYV